MRLSLSRLNVRTVLKVLADFGQFSWLALQSRVDLAAENLFLRKQLALYRERQVKPRRADAQPESRSSRCPDCWTGVSLGRR
jgi:hypothetical protein